MGDKKPLVSFVIPTHNRADLLKECLDSVLNQTYNNIEVIVVNDNSSDNTLDILNKYGTEYPNLFYYNNEVKGGNAARNMGIHKAKGEYIAFMDDDDICEPYRIEEQLRPIIESNYYYNFVVSGFRTINSFGKILDKHSYIKPFISVGFPQRWFLEKDLLMKANLFDVDQPALQDIEFFFRLKNLSNIFFSSISVVNIRLTPVSITKNSDKMKAGITRLIALHGNKMRIFERNMWLVTLCKKLAVINDWEEYSIAMHKINKTSIPISFIILYFAYLFKSTKLLKAHSRGVNLYFRSRYLYINLLNKLFHSPSYPTH